MGWDNRYAAFVSRNNTAKVPYKTAAAAIPAANSRTTTPHTHHGLSNLVSYWLNRISSAWSTGKWGGLFISGHGNAEQGQRRDWQRGSHHCNFRHVALLALRLDAPVAPTHQANL